MATRNFVPRPGAEGQIGTSEKPWGVVVADVGHFAALSGSISGSWGPCMTTIGFYRQYTDGTMDNQPIMVARYPQPIKLRKDTRLTFKIRQDW